MCRGVVACDFADVLALIAVGGEWRRNAARLTNTRLHRQREIVDLRAGIVVVELAMNFEALCLDQARDRVAYCCASSVADVQRTGGIGRDKLHDHFFRLTLVSTPVAIAFGEDARDDLLTRTVGQCDS